MSNSHIINTLKNYSITPSPGYAILLTGEWGSGKTHLIKTIFQPDEMYYITLFGLTSLEDVYAAIFSATHPSKAKIKKAIQQHKTFDVGIFGFKFGVGSILSGLANTFIRETVNNDKVLILDDLERSTIKPNEILGAINKYIEHHNCRVIVIAHDEKFSDDLIKAKEKVFGLTLKLSSDTDSCFKSFTKDFRYSYIREHCSSFIIDIFNASGCKSLRILKHTIDDCLKLTECLEVKHKNNPSATEALLKLFTVFSIESRAGNITRKDLLSRLESRKKNLLRIARQLSKADDKEKSADSNIDIIIRKYQGVSLDDEILSDEILTRTIFDGYYNQHQIQESLDNSVYFIEPQTSPSWLMIYRFDNLEDEILNIAIDRLRDDFNRKKFTSIGEMLHLFHALFLTACRNVLEISIEQAESDCKAYIDSLLTDGQLKTPHEDGFLHSDFSESYAGKSFWCMEEYEDNINRVKDYLAEKQEEALKNHYAEYAHSIIECLKNHPGKIRELISRDDDHQGSYADIPVMASIDVKEFVDAWLKIPRIHWSSIRLALILRYNSGKLANELADEREWIKDVIEALQQTACSETGFAQYRLERLANYLQKKILPS
ncbi:hypothetical protein EJP617_05170 [Erwinia sp. Ejp617]|nr:P-loop NTPase fold protein [Erwinia sp. Ejp617]ADP10198.1 hypothetical protein EJP617_05170 [Erwinia sp. Ejp617]